MADSLSFLTSALAVRPLLTQTQQELHGKPDPQDDDDDDSTDEIDLPEDCATPEDEKSTNSPNIHRHSKSSRSKLRLQFCYPPPVTKQRRLHARPKILLQLHRISKDTRPTPTYDVLSTTAFESRLAQQFPDTFSGRRGSGPDDLVVVKSEDYSGKDERTDAYDDVLQRDDWKSRTIVAAISFHSRDDPRSLHGAKICLSKGRTWIGSPMPNGGYEAVAVEQTGQRTVARWIPRRDSRHQPHSETATSSTLLFGKKAFNFSLIDPHSRRHAVIATFDAQGISISDRYSSPKTESTAQPSTATVETSSVVDDGRCREVDDALRTLIIATGIWVSYCEGFFGCDLQTAESRKAKLFDSPNRRRGLSIDVKDIKDFKKQKSPLQRASSMQGLSTPPSPLSTPLITPPFLTPPRRTQSAGSPSFDQLHNRQITTRRGMTLDPIFDSAEISSFASQISVTNGERRDLVTLDQTASRLSLFEEKHEKRSKSVKKLCRSFKLESGSSSP